MENFKALPTRTKLIIVGILLAFAIGVIASIAIATQTKKSDDDIQTVTVTSPLEHVSASAVPYYKGDYSSGDQDLVNTQYTVFAMDQLKVPDDIKNALQFGVPAYLRGYQAPNVEPVFIHLDVNSVKYANANDYSFNFYTDSPEQYFSYTVAPTDDARSNAVITAIGGGWL